MDTCLEKALLTRIREGDDTGFETLVAAHSPRLLSLAWRLVGVREDAEEITQEAFLRLHRSIGDFRGDSSVATWLYRTVTRLAIDHLRRRKLRERIFFFRRSNEEADPMDFVPDPAASPGERYFAGEIRQRIDWAMQRLSARQRVVFTLRHHEEMPLREIAAVLGLEEGTVKAHLHRAVRVLRRELKDLQGESS
jgi:RNA polymerase sigma-70 factor (ECF subfamily)